MTEKNNVDKLHWALPKPATFAQRCHWFPRNKTAFYIFTILGNATDMRHEEVYKLQHN
jgi:hypothetical protein